MATCGNCGWRRLLLARQRCEACGKQGCARCLQAIALVYSPDLGESRVDRWRVCSDDCLAELAGRLARHVAPPSLWTLNPHPSMDSVERQFTFARPFRYRPRTGLAARRTITVTWLGVTEGFHNAIRAKVKVLSRAGAIPEYANDLEEAAYLMRVGLRDQASQLFRKWQMYDEATSMVPTARNVTIDLAPLIKYVRDEGLSIPFRCKACGSTVRIDAGGRAHGNQRCAHCGSTYDKLEVMELIATVLG